MSNFPPGQDEIIEFQKKLSKLLMISVSQRYALLYNSNLTANLIGNMNMEGSPNIIAMSTTTAVIKYGGEKTWNEFKAFIEAQTPPDFTNLR